MKKILFFLIIFCFIFSLSACGEQSPKANSYESSVYFNIHTENGVSIEKTAFPENTVIKIIKIENINPIMSSVLTQFPSLIDVIAYDISATAENIRVQPSKAVKVNFPIPESYLKDEHYITVFYISDTGQYEAVPTTVTTDRVTATLSHFSTYAVAVLPKEADNSSSSSTLTFSSQEAASEPNTNNESKSEATKPIDIPKGKYKIIKPFNEKGIIEASLTFSTQPQNKLTVSIGEGITFKQYYNGITEGIGSNAPTYNEMFDYMKSDLILYNNEYYYISNGQSKTFEVKEMTDGFVSFSNADSSATGSLKYYLSNDSFTVTELKGNTVLSEYLTVGDILVTVK